MFPLSWLELILRKVLIPLKLHHSEVAEPEELKEKMSRELLRRLLNEQNY
jgi:hypothetical protein